MLRFKANSFVHFTTYSAAFFYNAISLSGFLQSTLFPCSMSGSVFFKSNGPKAEGTFRPDWICMRVVKLDRPLKSHQPL
jgi:hypothetical protein